MRGPCLKKPRDPYFSTKRTSARIVPTEATFRRRLGSPVQGRDDAALGAQDCRLFRDADLILWLGSRARLVERGRMLNC